MKKIFPVYLASGWEDPYFQMKLGDLIENKEKLGFSYHDVKISSKGNHCIVLFSEENN
jgi:hypothetical protein